MSKKTILITGASSGIGEALALEYASQAHNLLLTGRNADRIKQVSESCERMGSNVTYAVLDVQDQAAMTDFILTNDEIHPIDVMIANAGISGGTAGLSDQEIGQQIRQIYDVNVMGVINTIEPIMKKMMDRKSGQIALMSSMASYAPWPGAPAYASSKSAVRFLGHSLRGTLASYGIKVNVICPGFIESRITDKNDFPMPFFKKAGYAAVKIRKGLEKDKMTISFPLPVSIFTKLMGILPDSLLLYINSKMPEKTAG